MKLLLISLLLLTSTSVQAQVIKSPTNEALGQGPIPYNYRVIDKNIHAGGHPLNPANHFGNSDKQALAILKRLKAKGVRTIIDLENTGWIQKRYKRLLHQAGIKRLHVHMHATKVPNKQEWQAIKQAMQQPVYIHCKWGADRTGAVIGRYLAEEKGYASEEAYQAVTTGGSHAGYLGGLKKWPQYINMKRFVWGGIK